MAVYSFITIETNLLGDSGVTLKEQNTQDGMSMLLGSLGNTNYTVSKICVWADSPEQLENIIFIEDIDANGNVGSVPMIPYLDANQLQNQCCFDLTGYVLSVNSKIRYQINGSTTLRLSFSVDTTKALSVPKQIQIETGVDEIKDIRAKIGQNEPEEKSGWDKIAKPSTGYEPEEKKPEKIENVLTNQEQLSQELTQSWPENKLEDLYAPKSDPTYLNKQENMDKEIEVKKPIISEPVRMLTKVNYNSNLLFIIIGGAVALWVIGGKKDLLKEISK